MGEHDEQIVFEMGYNKGFKDGIKGSIPKADYEARLKADMVAILTGLKMEIDKMSDSVVEGRTVTITSWKGMQKRICKLIQSRIDELKEQEDGTNEKTSNWRITENVRLLFYKAR